MAAQVESETKEMTVQENVPGEEMRDSKEGEKVMTEEEKQKMRQRALEQRKQYIRELRFQIEVLKPEAEFSRLRYEKLNYDYQFDMLREKVNELLKIRKQSQKEE